MNKTAGRLSNGSIAPNCGPGNGCQAAPLATRHCTESPRFRSIRTFWLVGLGRSDRLAQGPSECTSGVGSSQLGLAGPISEVMEQPFGYQFPRTVDHCSSLTSERVRYWWPLSIAPMRADHARTHPAGSRCCRRCLAD